MIVKTFDTETTERDAAKARIVEIAVVGDGFSFSRRCNPGVPIPPDATAVHGVTDADVASCPPFSAIASEVAAALDCDLLCGFNSIRFDVVLLSAEFERAGVVWMPPPQLDASNLDKIARPRTLSSAVHHWLNRKHEGAHGAEADALATAEVLESMRMWHADWKDLSLEELADLSRFGIKAADPAGKLKWDGDALVFAFGQHINKPVRSEPGYVNWMAKAGFPATTVAMARAAL